MLAASFELRVKNNSVIVLKQGSKISIEQRHDTLHITETARSSQLKANSFSSPFRIHQLQCNIFCYIDRAVIGIFLAGRKKQVKDI